MKLLRTACVLGLALCLATSVYAGTQSVKISGDLAVRGIMRGDYDLDHDSTETGGGSSDWQSYIMSTTEVQIDTDLTDNVSAVLRLLNQRDWNDSTSTATEFDVILDLAYIEFKEFLYSPLTLKIGRQDIWFGKGFVIGAWIQDADGNLNANEYSAVTAFDAIRATLDYDPWTIDGFAATTQEGNIASKDDLDLYGVNVGYLFDVYNAEAEAYYFFKDDRNTTQPNIVKDHNTVHTLGLRGSGDPIESWTVALEAAYQLGDYVAYANQTEHRERSAWAVDASVECRHFKEMYAWKPVLGVEYIYYSGDNKTDPIAGTSGTYTGWDVMYRGKFDSAIRDFYGLYYASAQTAGEVINPESALTNQHEVAVYGSLQPTDALSLDGKFFVFWQDKKRTVNDVVQVGERDEYIGSELDLSLTWDYTEDVSFSLLTAWFFPGDFYSSAYDDVAKDVVATMKMSF